MGFVQGTWPQHQASRRASTPSKQTKKLELFCRKRSIEMKSAETLKTPWKVTHFTHLPPNCHRIYSTAPFSYTQHVRQQMEDSKKSEGGESESPPLQVDPKWCVRWATYIACAADHRADVASKMLSDCSSNPSRPAIYASTSTRRTRGRRPSTI